MEQLNYKTTRKEKGFRGFLTNLKSLPLVFIYLISTYLTSFASEIIIGYAMIFTLGPATFKTPVMMTTYTALAYILAFTILAGLPKLVLRSHKTNDKPNTKSNPLKKFIGLWQVDKKDLGVIGLPTFLDITLSLITFVGYTFISYLLLELFKNFSWFQVDQAQDVGFSHYLVGIDRIFAFISLVILAPVFEELIFRGWLFGKLRKKLQLIPAILLTSILFGAMHGQWNVGVNVFALSLFLCGLREFTGTIYASILLHMIKNGIAFYFMYVIGL